MSSPHPSRRSRAYAVVARARAHVAGAGAALALAVLTACADRALTGPAAASPGEPRRPVVPNAFVRLTAGFDNACALRVHGTFACWGANSSGQSAPPAGVYTQVSAGGMFTCAVRAGDGAVVCWGANPEGQAAVPAGLTAAEVSVGFAHSCARAGVGRSGPAVHARTRRRAGAGRVRVHVHLPVRLRHGRIRHRVHRLECEVHAGHRRPARGPREGRRPRR